MKSTSKVYFPGLSALRFFAATLVIIHHVEQYKFWASQESVWGNPIVDSLGHQSVSFFFVLSGFLITYLLMVEYQKNGAISLPKFYWRRVLRIWPLYFLIVALALVIAPMSDRLGFGELSTELSIVSILSLVFILPNLLRVVNPTVLGANQLWSVGIEEQFYAFWPILISRFIKKVPAFLIGFIIVKFSIHMVILSAVSLSDIHWLVQLEKLYQLFPVEQMAVGGLGAAILFYKKQELIEFLMKPSVLLSSILLLTISSSTGLHFTLKTYIDAVFFTIILVHVVKRPILHKPLESSAFIHLGNISYGIYMWHTLVIYMIMGLLNAVGPENSIFFNLILYIGSVVVTIGIAHLSYQYFETPFLKMKERFSIDFTGWKSKWVSQ